MFISESERQNRLKDVRVNRHNPILIRFIEVAETQEFTQTKILKPWYDTSQGFFIVYGGFMGTECIEKIVYSHIGLYNTRYNHIFFLNNKSGEGIRITLSFDDGFFWHLTGLHHLSAFADTPIAKDKKRAFNYFKSNATSFTDSNIQMLIAEECAKSKDFELKYPNSWERISRLLYLPDMLELNGYDLKLMKHNRYKLKSGKTIQYSSIDADYVLQATNIATKEKTNMFIARCKANSIVDSNVYSLVSFIPESGDEKYTSEGEPVYFLNSKDKPKRFEKLINYRFSTSKKGKTKHPK